MHIHHWNGVNIKMSDGAKELWFIEQKGKATPSRGRYYSLAITAVSIIIIIIMLNTGREVAK